ncbi:MAG: cell wall-binding repeat-containing protein, partial [Coriobacteriales bacterium]
MSVTEKNFSKQAKRVACAVFSLLIATMGVAVSAPETASAATTHTVAVYSGADRYSTAAYEASAAYDAGAKSGTAVLVGGEGDAWADAHSASSLAGAMRAPILITEKDSLSSSASSVISSKGISNVIVIGGTEAVSSDVVESLESLGCSVERISGSDRYDTQAAIYEYG